MAYTKKKTSGSSAKPNAYDKLKQDLEAGTVGNAYIFHGEETYLRDRALSRLREALIPDAFSEFNYHKADGKTLTAQSLEEMAEAMPMMADRTLVVVSDWDLFRLPEEQREKLIAFLSDVPEHVCMVFVYDTIEYKPNRTMKKLCKALDGAVQTVEFKPLPQGELLSWIGRRVRERGKEIDRRTAEHLVFTCGELMTGLAPEIDKLCAYASGKSVTVADIDAAADPVLSAEVFRLSDAVLGNDYDKASVILGDLLKMQTEPILILAAMGSQLRRIYTARLALDSGRDRAWLMDLWGMRSDYPAKLLLSSARQTTAAWCTAAVRECQKSDLRMKSEAGLDAAEELKGLLVRLGAERLAGQGGGTRSVGRTRPDGGWTARFGG